MAATVEPLPFDDAIAAFRARTGDLRPTFAWQDLFEADHARSFTVAKSAGFDILGDISKGLQGGLNGGTSRDFVKELTPILQEKGWWGRSLQMDPQTGEMVAAQLGSVRRLKLIFDVNMRVSYAAGHWASFERNKAARPYLRYVAILDQATRPEHAARHNLCLPVDHPYWDVWAPPCGWNCRCTLQSLSQHDVDRMQGQLKFAPPAEVYRDWTNKRTGEVTRLPEGIDPGWAYNPGRAGFDALQGQARTAFANKTVEAPSPLARAGVADAVASDDFETFTRRPSGSMPVMTIDERARAAMERPATVALLSADTMSAQRRDHSDLGVEDYRRLPDLGAAPTLILQDGDTMLVLKRLDAVRWLQADIATTEAAKAASLLQFRFVGFEDVLRLLERGLRILLDRR